MFYLGIMRVVPQRPLGRAASKGMQHETSVRRLPVQPILAGMH